MNELIWKKFKMHYGNYINTSQKGKIIVKGATQVNGGV
jgi:hypothetical protein